MANAETHNWASVKNELPLRSHLNRVSNHNSSPKAREGCRGRVERINGGKEHSAMLPSGSETSISVLNSVAAVTCTGCRRFEAVNILSRIGDGLTGLPLPH